LPAITVNEAAGLYQEHAEHLPSWPTIRYLLEALVYGPEQTALDDQPARSANLLRQTPRRSFERLGQPGDRECPSGLALCQGLGIRHRQDALGAQLTLKVPSAPRELEIEEEAGLFLALRNDVSDAVDFLLKSGWRRAEVLGLRWSDVSFPRKSAVTRIKGAMSSCARSLQPSSKFWRGNPVARMPRPRPSCSPMSARKAVAVVARANAIP
jgi:integrase